MRLRKWLLLLWSISFGNKRNMAITRFCIERNHQSRILEQKLREMHIPYYLSGGLSFFERSGNKRHYGVYAFNH